MEMTFIAEYYHYSTYRLSQRQIEAGDIDEAIAIGHSLEVDDMALFNVDEVANYERSLA
jgi:hypothetical protein